MSTWREFINENADTLGISLFFSVLGSGLMLYVTGRKTLVSPGWAICVFLSGLIITAISTAIFQGHLHWDIFWAPLIGFLCGITGIFALLTTIKVGQRFEKRGDDVGDALIKRVGAGESKEG